MLGGLLGYGIAYEEVLLAAQVSEAERERMKDLPRAAGAATSLRAITPRSRFRVVNDPAPPWSTKPALPGQLRALCA